MTMAVYERRPQSPGAPTPPWMRRRPGELRCVAAVQKREMRGREREREAVATTWEDDRSSVLLLVEVGGGRVRRRREPRCHRVWTCAVEETRALGSRRAGERERERESREGEDAGEGADRGREQTRYRNG
jgi:hypothetical protein